MTRTPGSKSLFAVGVSLALGFVGCSAKVNTVEVTDAQAPTPLSYTIDFQNQANAIGSALVQVLVFDVTKSVTDTASRVALCSDLVNRRKARRDYATYTQVGDSALVSPCELISSDTASAKGQFVLPYGTYALLVTAQKNATEEILVGCGVGDAKADATNVTNIPLESFSQFVAVPSYPQCNRLVDRCAGGNTNCPAK